MRHNTATFATLGIFAAIAIISGAMVASTYYISTSTSSNQGVSSQSITSSDTSTISSSTHGWINSSEGTPWNYAPVIFGADYNSDLSPMGPSVEIGQQANPPNPFPVPAETFVAENFAIVEPSAFSSVLFSLLVPRGNANVTTAVYLNGKLIAHKTTNLNEFTGLPPNLSNITSIDEGVYLNLNKTTIQPGDVVTIAFLADGTLSMNPVEGIPGNSSIIYNTNFIPPEWMGTPAGSASGPMFFVRALL